MTQNTVQSTYSRYAGDAIAGMIARTGGDPIVDSRVCESASAGFGLAVSQGTADTGFTLGGTAFCGVTIRDITLVHSTADRYEQYDNAGILASGDIWVTVGTDVVAGHEAFYNSSTGAFGAHTIANAVAVTGTRFLDTVTSGGVARVRIFAAAGKYVTT